MLNLLCCLFPIIKGEKEVDFKAYQEEKKKKERKEVEIKEDPLHRWESISVVIQTVKLIETS